MVCIEVAVRTAQVSVCIVSPLDWELACLRRRVFGYVTSTFLVALGIAWVIPVTSGEVLHPYVLFVGSLVLERVLGAEDVFKDHWYYYPTPARKPA